MNLAQNLVNIINQTLTSVNSIIYQFITIVNYALIILAIISKIPQIMKIINNKNVIGVSFASVILQCINQIITLSYNIKTSVPFSLYGDVASVFFQNIIIVILFFVYSKKQEYGSYILYVAISILLSYILFTDFIPKWLQSYFVYVSIALFCCSRLVQLADLIKLKKIGSLSPLNYGLIIIRNGLRLYTLWISSSDIILYIIHTQYLVMNTLVLIGCYFYRDKKIKTL